MKDQCSFCSDAELSEWRCSLDFYLYLKVTNWLAHNSLIPQGLLVFSAFLPPPPPFCFISLRSWNLFNGLCSSLLCLEVIYFFIVCIKCSCLFNILNTTFPTAVPIHVSREWPVTSCPLLAWQKGIYQINYSSHLLWRRSTHTHFWCASYLGGAHICYNSCENLEVMTFFWWESLTHLSVALFLHNRFVMSSAQRNTVVGNVAKAVNGLYSQVPFGRCIHRLCSEAYFRGLSSTKRPLCRLSSRVLWYSLTCCSKLLRMSANCWYNKSNTGMVWLVKLVCEWVRCAAQCGTPAPPERSYIDIVGLRLHSNQIIMSKMLS